MSESRGRTVLERLRLRMGDFFPIETQTGYWLRWIYHGLTPTVPRVRFPGVLEAFAQSRNEVFFIQIGSNDAGYDDPLRRHIRGHGWRGIMIEPVPHVFARLRERYAAFPRLKFENIAISATSGSQPFYTLRQSSEPNLPPWYDMLGSFSKANVLKHAQYLPDIADRIVAIDVRCLTLDQLCAQHHVQSLDVLHIDAEGYDFEIIKTVDFARLKPGILLFEHRHLTSTDQTACQALLLQHGYRIYRDRHDTFCIHSDLLSTGPSALRESWARLSSLDRLPQSV